MGRWRFDYIPVYLKIFYWKHETNSKGICTVLFAYIPWGRQNTYLFSCVQGAKWQWIHKTYWHKIEKYVFFLQTREVNICSIPSVQHIFSLSLKLAILLFVRHNIRIFDFSTFHNIMSFLFDMIFFEFLNKFFLQQSIILCTFNI